MELLEGERGEGIINMGRVGGKREGVKMEEKKTHTHTVKWD